MKLTIILINCLMWLMVGFGRSNKDIAKEIGCDPSLISIYKKRIETEGEIYG